MNRKVVLSLLFALALLLSLLPVNAVAQTKPPSQPVITADVWGEVKGFPIVFPPNFDRPRIGQEFPYVPALRTDPTVGLKRWVIPAEITPEDLRYAPFPSYNPANLFKNVPKSPVDQRILGGPVPIVNYIPDLFAEDYCDARESFDGKDGIMAGGLNTDDFVRRNSDRMRFQSYFIPGALAHYRMYGDVYYGVEEMFIRRACALRRDTNAVIYFFQNLPIFYPPRRYRAEVFNRLPAKTREKFNNAILKTPDEFPQVFFFSKDPSDPLFAVLDYNPLIPASVFTPLPFRMLYVGNRTSLGIGLNTAGFFADFYLLTTNPDNLCYVVNYNNRGAPFAFCGFDVHNPPVVSVFFYPNTEHWTLDLNMLGDFYGYAVHNIPMVRVPQASKYIGYQEYRATQWLFSDTGLRMLSRAYPPYLMALMESDPQARAQVVRKYSGKPFINSYVILYSEMERKIERGEVPLFKVQSPSPSIAARLPITTLTRLADERGHAAHQPVRPNTVVKHDIVSVMAEHPTAIDSRANYTMTLSVLYGNDFVAIRDGQTITADQRRIDAYNPDMNLKQLPGEFVIDKDSYRRVARTMATNSGMIHDYRNRIAVGTSLSSPCVPVIAYSAMAPNTSMFNAAPLLHFAQAGTGNASFDTPALQYWFTETLSSRGNAIGAEWARDVKKFMFPYPYPETYPESDTLFNNREGYRVRATMWMTYAQGALQEMSIAKVGRRDERLTVNETFTVAQNVSNDWASLKKYFGEFTPGFLESKYIIDGVERCRSEYEPFLRDFNRALDTWFPGKDRHYYIAWRKPIDWFASVSVSPAVYIEIFVRGSRDELEASLSKQPEIEINGRLFRLRGYPVVNEKTRKLDWKYVLDEVDGWLLLRIVERNSDLYPYLQLKK